MFQQVIIVGNLGADPEMRYTANGSAVTTFNVATSRAYTDRDGDRREETTWFRVVTWARTAEACAQYLAKGDPVLVEGRIQTRQWDKPDGSKGYGWELVAEGVKFLPQRGERSGAPRAARAVPAGGAYADAGGDIDPDDLPF